MPFWADIPGICIGMPWVLKEPTDPDDPSRLGIERDELLFFCSFKDRPFAEGF